jgi:hypothetical protein
MKHFTLLVIVLACLSAPAIAKVNETPQETAHVENSANLLSETTAPTAPVRVRTPLIMTLDLYGGYAVTFGRYYADLFDDNKASFKRFEDGWLTGLRLGLTLPNAIPLKFHIFTGIEYYSKSYTAKFTDVKDGILSDSDIFTARYSVRLNYMNINVGFKMLIKWFFVEIGGFGGVALTQYDRLVSPSASGDITTGQMKNKFTTNDDFGILLGIGCAFPVHEHITITLGSRLDIGILTTVMLPGQMSSNNLSLAFYCGVGFKLFKK